VKVMIVEAVAHIVPTAQDHRIHHHHHQ